MKSNRKSIAHANSAERNEQFEFIAQLREGDALQGQPIISVDTMKKELVGTFKNSGRRWEQEPTLVSDHDFRLHADDLVEPYGIYELQLNRGNVYVGTNADTTQFAAESIARWWQSAQRDYVGAKRLFILADGVGPTEFAVMPGKNSFRLVWPVGFASRKRSVTTRLAPPGGIRSSIGCSA